MKKTIYILISLLCLSSINNMKAQTLDSLLQLVVKNNPELKALEKEYEAELVKRHQIRRFNNPDIGIGVPISRPETRLGPQVLLVNASHMFPWFGTYKAKEDVVIAMSKVKYDRIANIKLKLFYELKVAYYQLYNLEQRKKIISEYVDIYHSLENISLAKVESGESTIADVLRIQLKLQGFEKDLKIIDNSKNSYIAQINAYTNQDFSTQISPTDSFPEFAPMNFNYENFTDKIKNNHPSITKINKEIEVSKNNQIIHNNMKKPSFSIGVDYSMVDERSDIYPIDNGKDILIPRMKINIPLYNKSHRSVNHEERINQSVLQYKKKDLINQMVSSVIQNKVAYDNAYYEIMFNYQQIKTTEMAYHVLLTKYSSSGKGFTDLLQIQNQLLTFQLNILQGQLESYLTRARIEQVTGE